MVQMSSLSRGSVNMSVNALGGSLAACECNSTEDGYCLNYVHASDKLHFSKRYWCLNDA